MANSYFRFKQFTVHQRACAMKVCTDSCLFGAWTAHNLQKYEHEPISILDIGSGTGLLSLMLKQKLSSATIDAVEIEPACFAQSKDNIRHSLWHKSIHVYNEDIRRFAPQKKYDVIISNPPFYESNLVSASPEKNIAHHDTGLTLQSLVTIVKDSMTSNGCFAALLPFSRAAEFEKAMATESFFTNKKTFVRQTDKHPFFRVMLLLSKENKEARKDEIIIRSSSNNYSAEFISLLKDYYLHL